MLGVTEFRALFTASALSTLGDQVTRLAVAVLVYERTNSPFFTAATIASSYLTWLVGGPFLSALADRWPRKRLLIACDLVRALLILFLAIPGMPLWVLFSVLILVGILAPPFESAKGAILPQMLSGDAYVTANALQGAARQGATVLGFLLGGLLVSLLSPEGALVLDALTFLVSAVLLARFVVDRPLAPSTGQTLMQDVMEGLSIVTRSRRLRVLLAYGALGTMTIIAPEALAVPVANELGGGSGTAGALTAALPAGFLFGSYAVLRIPPARRDSWLPALTALACAPLLLSATFDSVAAVAALWGLAGVFSAAQLIANASYMVTAPERARGRVLGLAVTAIMATQGITVMVVGALAEQVEPRLAVAVVAAIALALLVPLLMTPGLHDAPEVVAKPPFAQNEAQMAPQAPKRACRS